MRASVELMLPIIFVTAFKDQQIVQTTRVTFPKAFIIKPYDPINLESAIELAIFSHPVPNATVVQPEAMGDTFYVKDNDRVAKIRLRDIAMVEADGNSCFIVTGEGRYYINMRPDDLLGRLPHEDFIQVHNLFTVRKSAIKAVNFGEQTVRIADKDIPIGKAYREHLLSTLNLLS